MADRETIYKLFRQVQNQQEVDLTNKTPEEKAQAVVEMFEKLDEDHPLKVNFKKKS